MNCPKCGTPAADGAKHCRRCGAALSGKAAAAPSSSDEIELMPLEESKPPAHSSFEPPPDLLKGTPGPGAKGGPAGGPSGPPAPGDYVPKIRGANASPAKGNTNLIIGGVVLAIIVGFIAWRMFRTKNELVSGRAKVETSAMLPPNQPRIENIELTGKLTYTLEVNAPDGDLSVGFFKRSPKDPSTLAALKKLDDGFETVRKGDTAHKGGELLAGQYSWVVVNEGKKPARAKIKFVIQ